MTIFEVHSVGVNPKTGEKWDRVIDDFHTKEDAESYMFEAIGEQGPNPDAEDHWRYDPEDPDEYVYCIEKEVKARMVSEWIEELKMRLNRFGDMPLEICTPEGIVLPPLDFKICVDAYYGEPILIMNCDFEKEETNNKRGFNNRKYDNRILYNRMLGESNEQL